MKTYSKFFCRTIKRRARKEATRRTKVTLLRMFQSATCTIVSRCRREEECRQEGKETARRARGWNSAPSTGAPRSAHVNQVSNFWRHRASRVLTMLCVQVAPLAHGHGLDGEGPGWVGARRAAQGTVAAAQERKEVSDGLTRRTQPVLPEQYDWYLL